MTSNAFVWRVFFVVLVVLVVAGLWAARATLLLGFAAAMLAVGISVPAGWLQRKGLPRGWAIALAAVGIGTVFVLLLLFVLPRLVEGLLALLGSLPGALRGFADVYEDARQSSDLLHAALPARTDADAGQALQTERARALLGRFAEASFAVAPAVLGGVGTLVTALVHLGFVIFIALFFVIDPTGHLKASFYLLPERLHARAAFIWSEMYHTARTWITALSFSIAITATLVWIVLGVFFGMPNALVVAVFAGLATFVPNIGAFLPIIPIVIFGLESDPSSVLLYVPAYLGIQLLESNVITPSIVKSELSIPAGALLLFQLLVALAFGPLGLLLAVPMLAMLMVLVRELYSYDVLGLRPEAIALRADREGRLILGGEGAAPPATPEEDAPAEDAPIEEAPAGKGRGTA